jgi:apolipoprotein N-acyltransferase
VRRVTDTSNKLSVRALLLLLVATSVLLSLSFWPYGQFYLAWVGLVPWLIVVTRSRSWPRATWWGGLGGLLFNLASIAWLFRATIPGAIGLIIYLSIFWALAAAVIRLFSIDTAKPVTSVLFVAVIWTGCEWFRGWLFGGIPWMYLGVSQSPILAMCQVADLGGVFAVSFWLACVNATVAMLFLTPRVQHPRLLGAAAFVTAMLLVVFGYGAFRMSQRDALRPGPRVMVVQPNFLHARGGARTVTWEQQTEYHFTRSEAALANTSDVDLIVWSETVIPPMNVEARRKALDPRLSHGIHDALVSLVRRHRTSLIFGAYALLKFEGSSHDADIRNSTYLYSGTSDVQLRYDKVHLVPYGESVPFRRSIPWLHNLLFKFAGYAVEYLITQGSLDKLTVFEIAARDGPRTGAWRCVTPICFEDVDGALVAQMFRPRQTSPEMKRSDFIANVSNDGWFLGNMRRQHLQHAVFRSIENRVPTARACNTGISGFIDSAGRLDKSTLLTEGVAGERSAQITLDDRLTFYTRFGDVFGVACAILTLMITVKRLYSLSQYAGRGQGRG